MKLWLSKNSEVPVRVQLAEQIMLGIASGDLQPDERLPSTRELARRFGIHQNTVSAVYRSLTEQGHLENRKGSGVFVAANGHDPAVRVRLDELFDEFRRRADAAGYSHEEIERLLARKLGSKPPERIVVVQSDAGLRDILVEEVRSAARLPTEGVDLGAFSSHHSNLGLVVAMLDERPKLEPLLTDGCRRIYLAANSVPDSLSGRSRPAPDELVAVVSGWDRFLELAQVFLLAAGLEPESIVSRSTADPEWRRTADQAGLVICDSLTARAFPATDRRVRVFRLISPRSVEALRRERCR